MRTFDMVGSSGKKKKKKAGEEEGGQAAEAEAEDGATPDVPAAAAIPRPEYEDGEDGGASGPKTVSSP